MTTPATLGGYTLLGRLTQGGMAEILLARRDLPSGPRLFAIKRLLAEHANDPSAIAMLQDEARITSGLKHRNICEVYELGRERGTLYMVMEFIHGKNLEQLSTRTLASRAFVPEGVAAVVVGKVAAALDFAHRASLADGATSHIIHRDVSPKNVLVSYDGAPKLIDFGIAKATGRIEKTKTGVVKGKFAYMSPEQIAGGELDGRSDVFSLGAVLYELLSGASAFEDENVFFTLRRVAAGEYTSLAEQRPEVSPLLVDVVAHALAPEPEARFPHAGDMANALLDFAAEIRASERSVGDYMRQLFVDDYLRESNRIKTYVTAPAR